MISFRTVFLVISTLIAAEFCSASAPWNIGFSACILSCVIGILGIARFVFALRQNDSQRENHRVRAPNIDSCWAFLYAPMLFASGWLQHSKAIQVENGFFLAGGFLFLPQLVALCAFEAVTARQDAQRLEGGWTDIFLTRLRLGELASLVTSLSPFLLISGARDLLRTEILADAPLALVASIAILGLVAFLSLYPILMGFWLGAGSVQSETVSRRASELLSRVGLPGIRIRELQSDGRLCSAAVVGWFPWSRSLWLGDGLIERLSDEELDMVLLHEAAHIRENHFWYRLFPILWAFAVSSIYFCVCKTPPFSDVPLWLGSAISTGIAATVLLVGMGVISRRCELDADQTACDLAEDHCVWAIGHPGLATARLATALSTILGASPESSRRSWMHPSLTERLKNLAEGLAARKRALLKATAPYSTALSE